MILIAVSGFLSFLFSGIEAGFLALNPVRIRRLARSGNRAAQSLQNHLDDPDSFLWTVLIGNTIANLTFVAVVVYLVQIIIQLPVWLDVFFYVVTFFVFYTFLDLLPKMLVRRFPNRLTILLTYPFGLFFSILVPFAKMISTIKLNTPSERMATPDSRAPFRSRDELRRAMQESGGDLRSDERSLIERVLELQDQTVFSLMNPFDPELAVSPKHSLRAAMDLCKQRNRSRILVRETQHDQKTTQGVFYPKKALFSEADSEQTSVGQFTTPAFKLKQETPLDEALQQMKASGARLAVVVDPQEREIGVVSINDILRKIFTDLDL